MKNSKKLIAIVTPCYNEVDNIEKMVDAVRGQFKILKDYDYIHLFIDNNSEDGTYQKIIDIAKTNPQVRAIINARNFGYIRSSFYGLIDLDADATVLISCDFQEPPSLIYEFVKEWERGESVVAGIKISSDENAFKRMLRTAYYKIVNKFSESELIDHFFDFALYDRKVILKLREVKDQNPYLRGLICELGFRVKQIDFRQEKRLYGNTKQNWYNLLDTALIGLTSQSKVPLRFATIFGVILSAFSLIVSVSYLVIKLFMWDEFEMGMAPIVVGIFFIASFQLISIGLIGEYIGSIRDQTIKRNYVEVRERVNFP
jgi:glycosyltransferase involved in cell wall biosynthesis